MSKKKNEREYIFERGDVITDLKRRGPRLILSAKNDEYEFMELKDNYFKDIFNATHVIKKGSISTQPASIVEKYFSILDLNTTD